MKSDFSTVSEAVDELYLRYLGYKQELLDDGVKDISELDRCKAWMRFEEEREELVASHGWTIEEYELAQCSAAQGACVDCHPHPAHEPGKCDYCDCKSGK